MSQRPTRRATSASRTHASDLGLAGDQFVIADSNVCYLDGNSLGRLPRTTAKRLHALVNESWGIDLIGGWNADWIYLPQRVGSKIARLIGAAGDEVIVADSTSVNLFKLATAALREQAPRCRIVTDATNFPSDLYVLEAAAEACPQQIEIVRVGDANAVTLDEANILDAIDETTALVSLSLVTFRGGQWYNLETITRRAHECGAMVLWDLSHAVGAVPIELAAANADLAVGCTYKYLCGGPGAPAFLYVREDLQPRLSNPLRGWFSHASPFQFAQDYSPSNGIERFLTGTPYVLSLAAIEAGVDLVAQHGLQKLRAQSVSLSEQFMVAFDSRLQPRGFELRSPRQVAQRGSHIALGHPEARRITAALIQQHRVVPDFRAPDNLRFGFAPLYTTPAEVERAIVALETVVDEKQFERVQLEHDPVT